MLCACIGLFLLVIAGFLLWSIFNPGRAGGAPVVGMQAGGGAPNAPEFFEVPSAKALVASHDAPVLLVSGGCGHCQNAKRQMVSAGTNRNILIAAASQELFSSVKDLNGVPALISGAKIVEIGAGPSLFKAIEKASPGKAAAAYKKHK